jgi:hypothetical protein
VTRVRFERSHARLVSLEALLLCAEE